MNVELIIAIITSASSLIVAVVSVSMNNRILGYKVDELKKQVEKHNNMVERVTILERDNKTAFNRIDEIRADIKDLRSEVQKK